MRPRFSLVERSFSQLSMTRNSTAKLSPVMPLQTHHTTGSSTMAWASTMAEANDTMPVKVRMWPARRTMREPIRHPAAKPRK